MKAVYPEMGAFCDAAGNGSALLAVICGVLFACLIGVALLILYVVVQFLRKRVKYRAHYGNAAARNDRLELDLNRILTYIAYTRGLVSDQKPKENLYKDPELSDARRAIYKDMCIFFGLQPKQSNRISEYE